MHLSFEVPFKDIFEHERDEKLLFGGAAVRMAIYDRMTLVIGNINPFYTEKRGVYFFLSACL